ncbi:MAG: hypothetical protein AB7L13_15305 [Acidimicrobiia bacterium]
MRKTPHVLVIAAAIALLLTGRAMTLAYLGRVGDGGIGDPPLAWRLPLLGDAAIGLTAPLVAYLTVRGRSLRAWAIVVVWHAIGIWDALSAYIVHTTTPWPSFFMIKTFGASMFFMAGAMHAVCIALVASNAPTDRRVALETAT